jgi:DNA-binding LacI/PurR family transcriptional regulator
MIREKFKSFFLSLTFLTVSIFSLNAFGKSESNVDGLFFKPYIICNNKIVLIQNRDPFMQKYRIVLENLINRIENGHFEVGRKLPAIRTLAKEFNVNMMTVHRALKELAMLEMIDSQIGDGTYITNRYPRGKKSSPSQKTGKLISFNLYSWDYLMSHRGGGSMKLMGAKQEAAAYGWNFEVIQFEKDCNQVEFIRKEIESSRPAGVLLLSLANFQQTRAALKVCLEYEIPVVMLDSAFRSEQIGVSSVDIDQLEGGALAGEYLLEKGVEKAGAIYYQGGFCSAQFMICQGAKVTFLDAEHEETDFRITGKVPNCLQMAGYRGTRKLLNEYPDLRGLVFAHELLAQGGIEYLREVGYTPGKDFFVAGGPVESFFDIRATFSKAYHPGAMWFSYTYDRCGKEAVRCLAGINSGDNTVKRIRISPEIVNPRLIQERWVESEHEWLEEDV